MTEKARSGDDCPIRARAVFHDSLVGGLGNEYFAWPIALTARDYATFSFGARVADRAGQVLGDSTWDAIDAGDLTLGDRPSKALGLRLGTTQISSRKSRYGNSLAERESSSRESPDPIRTGACDTTLQGLDGPAGRRFECPLPTGRFGRDQQRFTAEVC